DAHPVPDFKGYFEVFNNDLNLRNGQKVHFELGRSVVGQCGSLITRVLYVKKGVARQFAIVDAGFTDLIRPALYQAHHKIENISAPADAPVEKYDVVGPICESSDTFDKDVLLPQTQRGDLLALRSAGAYGEIMASQYNCRMLPGTLAL
ncbi:MAG: diaminopimelate decarboxylase, partial [Muribaculaceae bacterium]|nr:diaminopimelate decarboxylase [Muribaculaceae bacterium]